MKSYSCLRSDVQRPVDDPLVATPCHRRSRRRTHHASSTRRRWSLENTKLVSDQKYHLLLKILSLKWNWQSEERPAGGTVNA